LLNLWSLAFLRSEEVKIYWKVPYEVEIQNDTKTDICFQISGHLCPSSNSAIPRVSVNAQLAILSLQQIRDVNTAMSKMLLCEYTSSFCTLTQTLAVRNTQRVHYR